MAKVQVTKNWTISPNVRYTPYVSLVDCMGWYVYQNSLAMLAAGWTCKFSSDGTTGPTNASDTTNRITNNAAFGVRATVAASPQSWIVLQNVDGLQLLFTYQGASDDIARVSMSQGGLFTLAGTTTHQPTATDEVVDTFGTSIINATASGDRVMSIGCTNESWWNACYRAGSLTLYLSCDKIDTACDSVVFAVPYAMSKLSNLTANSGNAGGSATTMGGHSSVTAQNAAGWRGACTRVVTAGVGRIIRLGGGTRACPAPPANNGNFEVAQSYGSHSGAGMPDGLTLATPPALNNGTIPVFTLDWFGEKSTNMDGYLGAPIDWWYGHTSSINIPAPGDMIAAIGVGDTQATALRSNWLIVLGSGVIRPWLNAAASIQTT